MKSGAVGSCSPCEWAGPRRPRRVQREVEGYTGHSRNYFQEAVTCVPSWGTFQIPITPYSSRGKCFAFFTRGAPSAGSGTPEPPGSRQQHKLGRASRRSAVGADAWGPGYTSTHIQARAPTSPHHWPPPLILADHRASVFRLVPPFACYPESKLKGRDLRLLAPDQLTARSQPWEKGLGPGVWRNSLASTLPLRANLAGAVLRGAKGYLLQQPAA